jgi:hypothetical protein
VLGLGLLAVSAMMLIAGAELFTENAAAAPRGLGMTVFGAAFLLAGAEPEEMITAVIASGRHRPGLAAGDAIGANLTMLTLVLGLAALARPLPFGGRSAARRSLIRQDRIIAAADLASALLHAQHTPSHRHDRASVQPADHAGGPAQITAICALRPVTPDGRDLRHIGGSVRLLQAEGPKVRSRR